MPRWKAILYVLLGASCYRTFPPLQKSEIASSQMIRLCSFVVIHR